MEAMSISLAVQASQDAYLTLPCKNHTGQSIINQLGISARDLANEWEAHALNRGSADASQALLTLSSLGALEAILNKKAAATPASSTSSVSPFPCSLFVYIYVCLIPLNPLQWCCC